MSKKIVTPLVFVLVLFVGGFLSADQDLQKLVGTKIVSVKLLTLNEKDKWVPGDIPEIGKKVLTIMYTDADESDLNDPLSDAIKAQNYSKEKYLGIGIGNSKNAPGLWDVLIRAIAKGKMKKYKDSIILLDEELAFAKKLNLGDCNNKAVVMIVDKSSKILYIKNISSEKQSKEMIKEVLPIMDKLLK